VKFLVDAQLPVRLARFLTDAGHDSIHTTALPKGNRTPDNELAALADAEDRARRAPARRSARPVLGTSAGLHLVVITPSVTDEATVEQEAARQGVQVIGLAQHRHRPGPPGFVLG
jgi:hypothetical protein